MAERSVQKVSSCLGIPGTHTRFHAWKMEQYEKVRWLGLGLGLGLGVRVEVRVEVSIRVNVGARVGVRVRG